MALPQKIIIVLCGLPACGKTSLIRSALVDWCSNSDQGFSFLHLPPTSDIQNVKEKDYDAVFAELQQLPTSAVVDYHDWKVGRDEVELQVRKILEAPSPTAPEFPTYPDACTLPPLRPLLRTGDDIRTTILCIDDNMYYRSMRHVFYQLAKKCRAGYVQIYFDCLKEDCIARNRLREEKARVPDKVISDMKVKFEAPDPTAYAWEKHTIVYQGDKSKLVDQLEKFLADPLPDDTELLREQEQSRQINLASVTHQFELRARKIISDMIAKYKAEGNPPFNPATAQMMSKEMGKKKVEMVGELHRIGSLESASQLDTQFVQSCSDIYHKLGS